MVWSSTVLFNSENVVTGKRPHDSRTWVYVGSPWSLPLWIIVASWSWFLSIKKIELINYSHPWLNCYLFLLKPPVLVKWKCHNMQTHKFLYFLPLPNQPFPPEFLWDPVEFPGSKWDRGHRMEPNNWSWMEHPFSNFRTEIERWLVMK